MQYEVIELRIDGEIIWLPYRGMCVPGLISEGIFPIFYFLNSPQ